MAATLLVLGASAAQAKDIACPSQKFSEFYKAVSNDTSLQNTFISFPVRHVEVDVLENGKATMKEPFLAQDMLKKSDIKVFWSEPELKKGNLSIKFAKEKTAFTASLYVQNADNLTDYVFKKANGCFYLTEIRSLIE